MAAIEEAGESLEGHWAVAVFDVADRRSLLAFADDVRRRILAGTWTADTPVPEQLLPLSSAYELAARERLDLSGVGNPNTTASAEQRGERARVLEAGARRAVDLAMAIPLDETDAHAALYHALLLDALAIVAGRDTEFRGWLTLHRARLFDAAVDDDWSTQYLRAVVEIWTEVLDGSGPSGLEHAMELIATLRERRPDEERAALAGVDEEEEMALRFFFFALHHLTDAATELLLFRLHGEPADARQRLYVALSLAGEATAGDARIHAALDWVYEAGVRIIARRTPQLDLLAAGTRAHAQAH